MSIEEKLVKIADNMQKVYESGQKAGYDLLWDMLQQKGARKEYLYTFAYWTDEMFYPKYSFFPTGSFNAFRNCQAKIDLAQRLIDCGVVMDTSGATSLTQGFMSSYFTRLGVISTLKCSSLSNVFQAMSYCVTIDKVILKSDGSQTFSSTFDNLPALENITIEGVIGKNGVSFKWSTNLSKASIESIINALSTTTSGLTVTLSSTAVSRAFGSTTADEWQALKDTRPNWVINLA